MDSTNVPCPNVERLDEPLFDPEVVNVSLMDELFFLPKIVKVPFATVS